MQSSKVIKLLIAILLCQLVGAAGSLFTAPKISNWYAILKKPGFTPPDWLFGPVWTAIFLLMGFALFLVLEKWRENRHVKTALIWFCCQALFNVLWNVFFFGFESPFYGFIMLMILWLAILGTIISFARVSLASAAFLLPYILWVGFAGALNYSIWTLNPF